MSYPSKLMCGIILITVPTIQYGGYFLLQILSGYHQDLNLTEFQHSMFRAGHAHAGVLVILSLIAQLLVDYTNLGNKSKWLVRIAFPLSAILISGGFFGGAAGKEVNEPTGLIGILYVGAMLLFVSLLTLAIGLIRNKGDG